MSASRSVVQTDATLLANDAAGAYRRLTFAAPGVAGPARPGQFVALAVGGSTSANLLRRCFSIVRVGSDGGASERADVVPAVRGSGDPVEIVVAPAGPGTRWLASLTPGASVDLVGPLGRAFPLPAEPVPCVLVGGGYGSAPLPWLAAELRRRGCPVEVVVGAASADRLFGVDAARRSADGVTVTTDDGSAGTRGWVSSVLPGLLRLCRAAVVYACGPMPMLESVSSIAAREGAVAQVAVEEAMACGVGVCMTCVLPVTGRDGVTRMVRSCLEGPVFRGDRVRWEALGDGYGRVPPDALGSPHRGGR